MGVSVLLPGSPRRLGVSGRPSRKPYELGRLGAKYPEAITDTDLQRIDQLIDIIGLNDLEAIMLDDDILKRFDLIVQNCINEPFSPGFVSGIVPEGDDDEG